MLTNLREINRVLLAIRELSVKDNGVLKNNIVEECKKVVIGGQVPNHDDTIIFCLECKIIEKTGELIQLSSLGKNMLMLNVTNSYELNFEQKELLIKNCFINGFYKKSLITLLKQFYPDNKRQTFVYSSKETHPLSVIPVFLDYLKQCDLIQEEEHLLLVNPNFSEFISLLLHPESSMTEEELLDRLQVKNIVGKTAEKIVYEYEKKRLLAECSAKPESDLVQIISNIDVGAGYDINSFDEQSSNLHFNRFIEVKGSSESTFSLYWSRNEIEKAKELGSRYWIYFVPSVDIMSGSHNGEIIKIPNPIDTILKNEEYRQDCMKIWIRKNH